MVQGCGMSVVKFLVWAFNFVFVICGIALIVVGVKVKNSGQAFTEFLGSKYVTAPSIIIGLGIIIFFIAFLGCFGALKQNSCMVITFGSLLFLIFIIEIAAAIVAYVYQSELDDLIKTNMEKSLQNLDPNVKSLAWDDMQSSMKCCGVKGPKDYEPNTKFNGSASIYCCKNREQVHNLCPIDQSYQEGCYDKLKSEIKDKVAMVGGAGIGIAVIEVLGIIFAFCLASAIKKEYEGV